MIEESDTKVFGFWVYLMTDLVIFAALFAVFVVLRHNVFGGPSGREVFHLPFAFLETMILLTSSFTCALGNLAVLQKHRTLAIFWFAITFALGVSFLFLEFSEFSSLVAKGDGWQRSAFLSSYFALVGTHGLHIASGLLWMMVAMLEMGLRGLSPHTTSKILRLALFWHFLDIVWIFIFTVVYAMGVLHV